MKEALRQQMLLRALWRDDAALQGWVRGPSLQGLTAYRSNAGALAERALGSAYPTIAALVGTAVLAPTLPAAFASDSSAANTASPAPA